MKTAMKVYIVDNEVFYVESLCELLKSVDFIDVVGNAWDTTAALLELSYAAPDILISDIRVPSKEDGYKFMTAAKSKIPELKIIAITHEPYFSLLSDGEAIGWNGLIHKADMSKETLEDACRTVCRNGEFNSESIQEYFLKINGKQAKFPFSKYERQIIPDLYKGASNREIAEKFHVSPETVKDRVSNILEICNLKSRKQLAAFLLRNNLIDPNLI
ncbi:response regulator transcription factor [Panacibacter ginsenosidivorans]|uniref:Response regulator transcription factor n=1 Tax=Panacibacter ginsenosidivorans TaxID=1813871 RepID=A0A5B8VCL0_9BACT|nr:response regulator transcription factor [Panacibacter ginsenosidivorans]QEC69267.1 response regulator transcription factor [Panacibacter ginsenosidivorans]